MAGEPWDVRNILIGGPDSRKVYPARSKPVSNETETCQHSWRSIAMPSIERDPPTEPRWCSLCGSLASIGRVHVPVNTDPLNADHARITAHAERIKALEEDAGRLAEALDELMAWQNGAPLVTYETGWNSAMANAQHSLAQHETRGAGGENDG